MALPICHSTRDSLELKTLTHKPDVGNGLELELEALLGAVGALHQRVLDVEDPGALEPAGVAPAARPAGHRPVAGA